ncbi:uncharacterized protein LOC133189426 [Saccostrea echinata]|uniref:uncharacterized protein LOC133189426 n=1 Tax=Saccostrea echinata TaxID=191078 RepID=UPI002A810BB1|nr:uncharacterized protein LOC133189426 [Saccostrea echinata]
MTPLSILSESMFKGLCNIIGSDTEVRTRRIAMDIEEITIPGCIRNPSFGEESFYWSLNGSRRDGFRLPGSDIDIMFWHEFVVVLPENGSIEHYLPAQNLPEKLFLKCVPSQPGFVYLKTAYSSFYKDFIIDCDMLSLFVNMINKLGILPQGTSSDGNNIYVHHSALFQGINEHVARIFMRYHGPCMTFSHVGTEIYFASSLRGNFWPPTATEWITRSTIWPQEDTIQIIVNEGCHFVAIGSKQSANASREWRISFSKAENILVKSFNHCQFLTYGLLKMFFKEVVTEDGEPSICSYFVKTVVLWQIQENPIDKTNRPKALRGNVNSKNSCYWLKEYLSANGTFVQLRKMASLSILSGSVLKGLCNIIGNDREVRTRRIAMDIEEITTVPGCVRDPFFGETSFHWSLNGSRKDGFRLPGSEIDVMFRNDNMVVLPENGPREHYLPAQTIA